MTEERTHQLTNSVVRIMNNKKDTFTMMDLWKKEKDVFPDAAQGRNTRSLFKAF